ncbi:hypothetical protein CRG98_031736 [Punica granatum]|uniref:Uncharacterized protein n=1 Tax=Punica granatum TaxID=22663 RepID=A0A2I0IV33_PUNGR|nr:hypothetical protein CRG98_031736 [Punica granatum]
MDSREPKGLTALPLRGSAERSHGSLGSMSVSSPRIRGTSCCACMTTRYGWNDPKEAQSRQSRENGSARSLRPRHDPNVLRPEQTRKRERKFGKNVRNPVKEKWMNDGCARLIGPRTVTTSSRGRMRVVRNPWNVMARLAEVVGRNDTSEGSDAPGYGFGTRLFAWAERDDFGLSRVGWSPEYRVVFRGF